ISNFSSIGLADKRFFDNTSCLLRKTEIVSSSISPLSYNRTTTFGSFNTRVCASLFSLVFKTDGVITTGFVPGLVISDFFAMLVSTSTFVGGVTGFFATGGFSFTAGGLVLGVTGFFTAGLLAGFCGFVLATGGLVFVFGLSAGSI